MAGRLHSSSYKALCAALEAQRLRAGLTQSDLSLRLGKPQSFVSKVERGERRLDVVEFVEMAAATGADIPAILDAVRASLDGDAQ